MNINNPKNITEEVVPFFKKLDKGHRCLVNTYLIGKQLTLQSDFIKID